MPVGLQVRNDTNVIQIDENYKNVFLKSSGNLVADQILSVPRDWLIAFRPNEPSKPSGLTINAPTYNPYNPYIDYKLAQSMNYAQTSIKYWMFGPGASNAGNVGFQTFGPDGQILYNSNERPLRIVDSVLGVGNGLIDRTYSGRSIAVIAGMRRQYSFVVQVAPDYADYYEYDTLFRFPSDNRVLTQEEPTYWNILNGPFFQDVYDNGGTSYLMVDVSGI